MADASKDAILQRDGKTWAVITRTPGGMITPDHLEKVAGVARKHAIPTLKITTGQRIALVGIPGEKLGDVFRDLGGDADRTGGPCLHYVQACPGTGTCRFGVQDSLGLAAALEEKFLGKAFPAKLKMGVSGCPRSCGGLLGYYGSHAKPKERTARFMERVGMETLRSELLSLIPYIPLEKVK
jgi:NAD(P)H-nitrite reductase large subunit